MNNLSRYKNIFKEVFHLSIAEIEETSMMNSDVWDSLGHMSLIATIEAEFDIELNAEDVLEFISFKKGLEILEKYNLKF